MYRLIPVLNPVFLLITCFLSFILSSETKTFAISFECPAQGDSIIVGSIGDASNLIPMLASDATSHEIAGLIFNGLVKYDKNLNLTGDLAESWDISSDGLEITFHLRKGVKWQDGHEFTSEDVLFGFNTITNPKTPTAYAGDFLEVQEATAPDPLTFKVKYKKPFAPALSSWGNLVVLPKHMLEGQDITKSNLTRNPIGTGPYKLKEWKTQERIVLEANPDYFEGKPCIQQFIMRIIPDTATMFLELKQGGLDWMGLSPIQYSRQTINQFFDKNFKKYKYLSFSYTYMGFNLTSPLFQDKRIRNAVSHAIDKQELVEGILLGFGEPATGPYKPDSWFYNPDVPKFDYDPEKARKLLQETGWKDTDGDGILDKDGQKFSFTALTNQGNSIREKTAQIIQYRLKQVGIEMKIRTLEWTAFLNDFIDKRRFEAVILGWTTGQDPDIYDIWHSSKTGYKELNFIGYKNNDLDALLEAGRAEFDREKRKTIYFKAQEILANEQPYIFLYVPQSLPVIHQRFKGIDPGASGISHNFIQWWVPKDEQRYMMQ